MTREEAIAIIRKEYLCVDRDCDIERSCGKCDLMIPSKEPILKAYEMAIQALLQECVEPTQKHIGNALDMRCDDAISQAKTGYWIEEDMFDGDVAYRCSECNELIWIEYGTPKDNGYNFCPKCGKRLVEPQESEVSNG